MQGSSIGLRYHVFSITKIIIYILVIYTVLFPRDMLNIKELLLFSALTVSLPTIKKCINDSIYTPLLMLSVIMPFFTIMISCTIGNSSITDALSNGYVWLYLLLIPTIEQQNIDIKKPFLLGTQVIAIVIVSTWALDFFEVLSIQQNQIILFFNNIGEIQSLNKGILAIFGYAIYYKSSIAMVISLGYCMKEKKYIRSALFVIALFMTGARMNAIVALLICASILIIDEKSKFKRYFACICVIVSCFLILPDFVSQLQYVSSLKYSKSEYIKMEGVKSTFSMLNENKYMYIFGSGLGSYYYDTGRQMEVQLFELSFIDYFRQVGVFGYIPFLYMIIKPLKYLFLNAKWLLIAYIGYLIIAATNPLLVNSTSFICYLIILTCGFEDKRRSILYISDNTNVVKLELGLNSHC